MLDDKAREVILRATRLRLRAPKMGPDVRPAPRDCGSALAGTSDVREDTLAQETAPESACHAGYESASGAYRCNLCGVTYSPRLKPGACTVNTTAQANPRLTVALVAG